jgi:hypothetical protein
MDGVDVSAESAGNRFQDPGLTVEDLTSEDILVVCRSCGVCARVLVTLRSDGPVIFWPRRLLCSRCGLAEERPRGAPAWQWRDGTDPYFNAPLWLQEHVRGHVLWALNERHLDLLRDHVGARLRQRPPEEGAPMSVLERLPGWVTSAKHRSDVIRALERLQQRLPR